METPDSNSSSAEWHYTAGEGQAGPVSFEELKAKAAFGELHPRNDMAWCSDMDEWKPAGEIAGLFERKTTDHPPKDEAMAATSLEEKIGELSDGPKQPFAEVDLFPGAGRRWYLFMVYLFPLLWMVIAILFASFAGQHLAPSFQKLFLLVGIIVPTWAIIDASLSRLTNLGMSKLWFFGYFVPILNLWVSYRSFVCPTGYAKTKKMDAPGWFLAIVFWLGTLGTITSTALLPATMSELLKQPEIKELFEDFKKEVEKAKDSTVKPDEDDKKEDGELEEEEEPPEELKPAP